MARVSGIMIDILLTVLFIVYDKSLHEQPPHNVLRTVAIQFAFLIRVCLIIKKSNNVGQYISYIWLKVQFVYVY